MGIVLFIIIFSVVVIAHELGHMLIAKANGIGVVEFTVGMGPAFVSFTKGDTKYSIRLLPIGGACVFEGEDGLSSGIVDSDKPVSEQVLERVGARKEEQEERARSCEEDGEAYVNNTDLGKRKTAFQEASVGARIATVAAGPIFNFFLAFLFSLFIVGSYGTDLPIIGKITENGAAQAAGIKEGDRILYMNGKKIHLYREISFLSMLNKGEDISIVYERDGQRQEVVITPIYDQEAGRYYIGFGGGQYQKMGIGGTIQHSFYEVKYWVDTTIKSLELLVKGQVGKDDVSGPVGMAQAVNEIYTVSKPSGAYYILLNMLNFAILLSANLGVLNLLPIPALDGGRLVFLLVEAIRRKPIPPEKEGMVHFAGFVLLMILMVVVFFNDLSKLFS